VYFYAEILRCVLNADWPSRFCSRTLTTKVRNRVLLVKYAVKVRDVGTPLLLDKESLVYKCYEAVKNLKYRTYNWYNDFRELLTKWNLQSILEIEGKEGLTYNIGIREIQLRIQMTESKSTNTDIELIRMSRLLDVYCKNKTHVIRSSV